ncbi:ATP-binding protein [uncultured Rhodospira sp.]|uniref:ATP-binding response regulator n=1 Tax=uncultured Rhodospira sp. TaxID=1936189 RepID=UPI002610FE28|nr:ATP-binding protein [uncultured Rhodospira sp.]
MSAPTGPTRPTTSGDPIQALDYDVSAALLIDAIENMAEAFVLWDAQDRLVLCNERYARRFAEPARVRPGIRFRDLVDMNIRAGSVKQLDGIADADRHPDLYRQHRMRLHRDGYATGEVLSHDGRWYQFRERRTRSGGVVGLYADITDRKRAEARAREAQQAAEQANLAKSRFLAAASHDLRQPLHAMGIFLSVLEHRLSEPAALEVLTDLQECALALGGLFDSLLDISKLDAGVLQPDPRPVELGPLLAAVRREYGPLAERRGLRFRVVPSRLRVQTDPAMLGRILRNFCSNAVKYTRDGGVVVGARRQGADIRIDVADTGIGFPPERIDDVFQEFHRLPDPDPDQGQQGLGLGLAIASRLATLLGHRLSVDTVPGKGARFGVTVPVAPATPSTAEPTSVPGTVAPVVAPEPLKDRRILVLDDDPVIARGMARLLETWGASVITAANLGMVQVAWGEASTAPPDLLIVDFHLDDAVRGDEAIARLRRTWTRSVPAILLTGDTSPDKLRLLQGIDAPVLHKPVRPLRLRQLVTRLLPSYATGG